MTQAAAPSPSEAEGLISLWSLLDEAVQRSSDRSLTGRHVATILLDGAVEAAIALCRTKYLQSPHGAESLDQGYSKLLDALRTEHADLSGIIAWPEVWRLHRARNNAQHHQIPPDHDMIARWASAVDRFVNEAVEVTFGIRLREVNQAAAIQNEELRAGYAASEEALRGGDPVAALRLLSRVFDAAVRDYQQQHYHAMDVRPRSSLDDLGIGEVVISTVKHIEDLLQVAPFASDLAEYVWWRSLTKNLQYGGEIRIEAEEARRAATFVFSWILRWEAFAARYTDDRRASSPPRPPPRPSPEPDGSPVLDAHGAVLDVVEHRVRPGAQPQARWVLTIPYAVGRQGESTSAHVNGWSLQLGNALMSKQNDAPWIEARTDSWEAKVVVTVDPDALDVGKIIAELETRINDIRRRRREEEAEAAEKRAAVAVVNRGLEATRAALMRLRTDEDEPVFVSTDVRWDGEEAAIVAEFTDALAEQAQEMFQSRSAREGAPRLSHGHVMYRGVYLKAHPPPGGDIVATAKEALGVLRTSGETELRRRAEQEERLCRLRAELSAGLAQLSGGLSVQTGEHKDR